MSPFSKLVQLFSLLLLTTPTAGQNLNLTQDADGWQQIDFTGRNQTSLRNGVIEVTSNASASAFYYELPVPITDPFKLSWAWKPDRIFRTADHTKKSNDDYAARVYVVFRYGPLPWQLHLINYVAVTTSPTQDPFWLNPYSDKSAMVPRATDASHWQRQTATPLQDYHEIFDHRPVQVMGFAIMTDTDDTGQLLRSRYRDIQIRY